MLCTLLLFGLYYASTDGVLMALASPTIPERLRTSGFALITTGTATTRFCSSVIFGAVWVAWGPQAAVLLFLVGTRGDAARRGDRAAHPSRGGPGVSYRARMVDLRASLVARARSSPRWPPSSSRAGSKDPVAASPGHAVPVSRALVSAPHIVFRDTERGDGYGRVGIVPLAHPSARPALTGLTCDRVYVAGGRGLCLPPAAA